jgi:cell division septal protein FtsQ
LFDIPEAKKKLIDSQENLGRVTILKQFPKTLKLDITSYPSLYNTTIEESEYLVLLNGSITPGKRNGLLTLDMKFSEFPRFYEYKKILKAEELKSIFELEKLMKSNFLTIQSEKINYYIDEKEAHFILKS